MESVSGEFKYYKKRLDYSFSWDNPIHLRMETEEEPYLSSSAYALIRVDDMAEE
jgi:hypothetical protein